MVRVGTISAALSYVTFFLRRKAIAPFFCFFPYVYAYDYAALIVPTGSSEQIFVIKFSCDHDLIITIIFRGIDDDC